MNTVQWPTLYPSLYGPSTYMDALIDEFGFERVSEAYLREAKLRQPVKYARDSDPATSRRDGPGDVRRFSKGSHAGRLLLAFFGGHLTDAEATDVAMRNQENVGRSSWEGCRRRCSDLRLAGYIEDTAEQRDGRVVWRITDRGATAVGTMLATGWSA